MALKEKTDLAPQLTVKHHAFCLESKEPAEGYKAIEVFNPSTQQNQTKYVKLFSELDGFLDEIRWYNREHDGKTYSGLNLTVRDGDFVAQLDLPTGKRSFDTFLRFAENLDFNLPITFVAFKGRDDKTAFFAKQKGETVKWKFTKDNPHGCPEPRKSRTTGKWDFSDTTDWLLERLLEQVCPMVEAAASARTHDAGASAHLKTKAKAVGSAVDADDPFGVLPDDNDPF